MGNRIVSAGDERQADLSMVEEENLHRLRGLLLSSEREEIGTLNRRLDAINGFHTDLDERSRKIAEVLPGSFEHACHANQNRMAQALGPVLTDSIRAEMIASREEMAATLQPLMGRLVKGAVADSFTRLSRQVNEVIEAMLSVRGLKLRLKAIITGRSLRSLVLAELRSSEVSRLYLIERGSGKLLFCWSNPDICEAPDENAIEEVMTAVQVMTDFAPNRQDIPLEPLSLGASHGVLQGSPLHVIALETTAAMTDARRQVIGHACRCTLDVAAAHNPGVDMPLNREAMNTFATQLMSRQKERKKGRANPAYMILSCLLLAMLVWLGWRFYHQIRIDRAAMAIETDISDSFPAGDVAVDVVPDRAARLITVKGVGFGSGDAGELARRAQAVAGPYDVDFQLIVRDFDKARSERASLANSLSETQLALARAQDEVVRLRVLATPKPAPVDPREALKRWTEANAIFFSAGATPRNGAVAMARLGELAALMRAAPAQRIRIRGFADEAAAPGADPAIANIRVARGRAEFVAAALVQRRIAPERLIVVHSADPTDLIVAIQGTDSPNRRVEFSLAFADE